MLIESWFYMISVAVSALTVTALLLSVLIYLRFKLNSSENEIQTLESLEPVASEVKTAKRKTLKFG
jgi:hypothetical protein